MFSFELLFLPLFARDPPFHRPALVNLEFGTGPTTRNPFNPPPASNSANTLPNLPPLPSVLLSPAHVYRCHGRVSFLPFLSLKISLFVISRFLLPLSVSFCFLMSPRAGDFNGSAPPLESPLILVGWSSFSLFCLILWRFFRVFAGWLFPVVFYFHLDPGVLIVV